MTERRKALCPECGKPMRWDRAIGAWDCGPEPEHGFWDPENVYEYVTIGLTTDDSRGKLCS